MSCLRRFFADVMLTLLCPYIDEEFTADPEKDLPATVASAATTAAGSSSEFVNMRASSTSSRSVNTGARLPSGKIDEALLKKLQPEPTAAQPAQNASLERVFPVEYLVKLCLLQFRLLYPGEPTPHIFTSSVAFAASFDDPDGWWRKRWDGFAMTLYMNIRHAALQVDVLDTYISGSPVCAENGTTKKSG